MNDEKVIERGKWEKALADISAGVTPDNDKSVTVLEFADMFELSRKQAYDRLRRMVAAGIAQESAKYIARRGYGRIRVPSYLLIEDRHVCSDPAPRNDARRTRGPNQRRRKGGRIRR